MRYARRVDANLKDIVKAFRKLGFGVHVTNSDWDLTVWKGGAVRLVEAKDPKSPNLKRRNKGNDLIDRGCPIWRVMTVEDVLEVVRSLQTT